MDLSAFGNTSGMTVDGIVRQQAKARKELFTYKLQVDATDGHSRAGYRALRPDSPPPFTEVPHSLMAAATAEPGPLAGQYLLRCSDERPFRVPGSATFAGLPCQLVSAGPSGLLAGAEHLPSQGQLRQDLVACTPTELHDAFCSFWYPIWQRDQGAASRRLALWSEFEHFLSAQPARPALCLRSCAPDLWKRAIRRMKSTTATGICGWSSTDLKLLSDEAVEVLANIFHQAVTCGLPAHILRAKVSVLAKVPQPENMGAGTADHSFLHDLSYLEFCHVPSDSSGVAGFLPHCCFRVYAWRCVPRCQLQATTCR